MNTLLTAHITTLSSANVIITLLTTTIHRLKTVSKAARKTPVAFAVNAEQVRFLLYKILLFLPLLFFASDENGGKKERIFSRRICGLNTDFIHYYLYILSETNKQTNRKQSSFSPVRLASRAR